MIQQEPHDRGQVGVGTLIVFIAMVIVAAIAAGVFITAAGTLQTQSATASQESADQVSNRVHVVNAVGSDISGEKINHVNLTVGLSPSAGEVDLAEATVQWSGPNGTFNLVHNQSGDPADGDGNFYTYEVKDDDDSNPVLNARDDRLQMHFNVSEFAPGPVGESADIQIRITTRSGGTSIIEFQVPRSLASEVSVRL